MDMYLSLIIYKMQPLGIGSSGKVLGFGGIYASSKVQGSNPIGCKQSLGAIGLRFSFELSDMQLRETPCQ